MYQSVTTLPSVDCLLETDPYPGHDGEEVIEVLRPTIELRRARRYTSTVSMALPILML